MKIPQDIYESNLDDISKIMSELEDIEKLSDAMNSMMNIDNTNMREHELRYVSNLINRLVQDPDIIDWYDKPNGSQLELRQILIKKLNSRDAKYMDEVLDKLFEINDRDSENINNIIMNLITDPDIVDWFDNDGTEFKLRRILVDKLSSKEKNYINDICDKIIDMCDDKHNTRAKEIRDMRRYESYMPLKNFIIEQLNK